ncbi:MAG: tRNA lysidine(34) synthetase TilS [Clostridia bacterium]|nr:tRNA lysidine(34) synthetase TilS [Clostridia bacterium]
MLKEKVRQTIIKNKLIEKGEHIIIGLSGGPDSVCLFDILKSLEEEMNITLHAVHINHKFRPGAAEEDQAYVEKLCRESGTECTAAEADCAALAKDMKITGEEAGRKVRYSAFFAKALAVAAKLREEEQKAEDRKNQTITNVKIAVAHNMNDQAETLLFRLARGTGVEGLCGMEYMRSVGSREIEETLIPELMPAELRAYCDTGNAASKVSLKIIRPLLDAPRAEIEKYCKDHALNPQTDLTNLQPVYARNKIRLELIPYIDNLLNTDITSSMGRLARTAAEDCEFIREHVGKLKAEAQNGAGGKSRSFKLAALQQAPPAILSRLIADAFAEIGLSRDVSFVHIDAARELIMKGETGKRTEFPHGYALSVSYGSVIFEEYSAPQLKNTQIRARILKPEEWERLKEEDAVCLNRGRLGKNYALFDLEKLFEKQKPAGAAFADIAAKAVSFTEGGGACGFAAAEDVCGYGAAEGACGSGTAAEEIFGMLGLTLRTRREGDFLSLGEGKGNKRLQRYFMDEKVPRQERENIPMLASGREIIWITDAQCRGWGRTAKALGISKETEHILLLECE